MYLKGWGLKVDEPWGEGEGDKDHDLCNDKNLFWCIIYSKDADK